MSVLEIQARPLRYVVRVKSEYACSHTGWKSTTQETPGVIVLDDAGDMLLIDATDDAVAELRQELQQICIVADEIQCSLVI